MRINKTNILTRCAILAVNIVTLAGDAFAGAGND